VVTKFPEYSPEQGATGSAWAAKRGRATVVWNAQDRDWHVLIGDYRHHLLGAVEDEILTNPRTATPLPLTEFEVYQLGVMELERAFALWIPSPEEVSKIERAIRCSLYSADVTVHAVRAVGGQAVVETLNGVLEGLPVPAHMGVASAGHIRAGIPLAVDGGAVVTIVTKRARYMVSVRSTRRRRSPYLASVTRETPIAA
jgi:hypothetical protein